MSIFNMPRASAYGQNVKPSAGAKLYFYEAGTTTLKTVYKDLDETLAHTNPVVADSAGRFEAIYLSGTYKCVLKDADDTTITTDDDLVNREGDVQDKGEFDSTTNAGDYPASGSLGDLYRVTETFVLNAASGSHPLNDGDFIYCNKNGATGIDTDWDIIRGVDTAFNQDSNNALALLIAALKENTEDDYQNALSLSQGFLDQFVTDDEIDDSNSDNWYWRAGSKIITNDGVGGFITLLWEGLGTGQAITGAAFQPDMIWIKNRDDTDHHNIYDAIRGVEERIESSSTAAEQNNAQSLVSFDADGFTVGTAALVDTLNESYVAWCFECPTVVSSWAGAGTDPIAERTNANIGMSIIQFEGTAGATTINHSLGAAPAFMITKDIDGVKAWYVYHHSCGDNPGEPGDNPEDYSLLLNDTGVQSDDVGYWNDTAHTSTTISLGSNFSAETFIGYLFTEVAGFSKFGTYEGLTAGLTVSGLGYRPEMVIIKKIDGAAASWNICDDTRGDELWLVPDQTWTEATATAAGISISFTDDGFTVPPTATANGGVNVDGETFVYAAFGAKGAAQDIDLISEAQTADSAPSLVTIYALVEQVESLTLGTDLKFWASRVTGAESEATTESDYWTEGTDIEKICDVTGDIDLIKATVAVNGQTSGTAIRYRFVGANTKKMYFHGVNMLWQ